MTLNFPLKVLLVDNERPFRHVLKSSLANHYQVFEAGCGEEALKIAAIDTPDVIILDLGLPDMDGKDVVRLLREWTEVPVIIISGRTSEQEKVDALDAGADDYLTKPFGINEFLSRIRVALRYSTRTKSTSEIYHNEDLLIDLMNREVRVNKNRVRLTPIEYGILYMMVKSVGKVLTHSQLINQVWGENNSTNMHLLRVNISNVRRKIELDPLRPNYLLTETGVGYRLKETAKNS